jgi:diaminohydroxyphosphoribosylaminopyrimidine deaminase/5-amino-6-(5-phosphoribosylamino)uracil reductase
MRMHLDEILPFRRGGFAARGHLGSSASEDGQDKWGDVPRFFRTLATPLPSPWEEIFGPLRIGKVDDLVVVGQVGQSLDGRVATATGRSHYINCSAALAHLHRLRALVDAVVIGVSTVCADDPQLTVRRVSGPNPARVVIDPHGRLPTCARLLREGGRTIVITAENSVCSVPAMETMSLPAPGGQIAPSDVLAALAKLGLRRILVEGGANTLSRFLQANCLDRLHVLVAPLILGAGPPSFAFGAIDRIEEALHPAACPHRLGDDMLFDCDLSVTRIPVWRTNTEFDAIDRQ